MSKAHWLALAATPGIGGATARRLLERFGRIEAVFAAAPTDLATLPRLSLATAEGLLHTPLDALDDDIASLSDEGVDLLTWDDDAFPASLRALSDAPVLLFVRGALRVEDEVSAAIVGTREASDAGLARAERLARGLAEGGIPIVSGLALGIDTAAHWGALQADSGRTIALLGSGIRVIHPRKNADLAEAITTRGALLSELLPNTPPRGPQLMARDRLISGLSRVVIVVEAAQASGSLDTAARARKQGRAVFAVPGSPGTDGLLRDGARHLDPDDPDLDALAAAIRGAASAPPDPTPRQGTLW